MNEWKVRAIRFEQNERVFYTVVMRAGEILAAAQVDEWSAEDEKDKAGYQRTPSSARLAGIANYLRRSDAIMPVGGLLNARAAGESAYGEVLDFTPDDGQSGAIQSGVLTITSNHTPLWIVDMQHRLYGTRRAIDEGAEHLREFPVTFTIADGLSKLEEVEQFELINTTQKKVRTDLARRLMTIQSADRDRRKEYDRGGRLWEARGPVIADWLNKHGSVWEERIVPPNKSSREMPEGVAKETSFVTSLKPILQSPYFRQRTEEQAAQLIDRYWEAIAQVWPDAFAYPKEHVIQKTPGMFSLHAVFPEVVEIARLQSMKLTAETFYGIIKGWKNFGDEFWQVGNEDGAARYGSMKGFSLLAVELRDELPSVEDDLIA